MELVGMSPVATTRKKERAHAWKLRFALFWTVHVANNEDGSPLKVWLRFYERKQDPNNWLKWKTRYKGYPELEHELPPHYGY